MQPHSPTSRGMVPERDEVLRDVKTVIAEQTGTQSNEITESDALVDDLGCDSLDVVEISMELEEHFDISIPDEFGDKTRTIADVTDGVLQLLTTARLR